MTQKTFQLYFKTLQTKYKRLEIVIFFNRAFVRSNTYESIRVMGQYPKDRNTDSCIRLNLHADTSVLISSIDWWKMGNGNK